MNHNEIKPKFRLSTTNKINQLSKWPIVTSYEQKTYPISQRINSNINNSSTNHNAIKRKINLLLITINRQKKITNQIASGEDTLKVKAFINLWQEVKNNIIQVEFSIKEKNIILSLIEKIIIQNLPEAKNFISSRHYSLKEIKDYLFSKRDKEIINDQINMILVNTMFIASHLKLISLNEDEEFYSYLYYLLQKEAEAHTLFFARSLWLDDYQQALDNNDSIKKISIFNYLPIHLLLILLLALSVNFWVLAN